jgi:aminoglycoside N3'-acetyltransferase
MHEAEDRAGVPATVTRLFRPPADVARDYPADQWYIQHGAAPADAWRAIAQEATAQGMIRAGRIGQAQCLLFRAADVVGLYERRLRTDPYALFGLDQP